MVVVQNKVAQECWQEEGKKTDKDSAQCRSLVGDES